MPTHMRRFVRRAGGAALTWVGLVASLTATTMLQQPSVPPPAAPDVTKLGPQVGDKVPDFSLTDQHGQARTLATLMGPKGLILVFNRSADW